MPAKRRRTPPKKAARKPWYVRAFEKDYLTRYQHRSDDAAAVEVAFVMSILKLRRGAKILDLCCGAGRHARAFAAAEYNVIGIDLSADLLRVARKARAAKTRSGQVRYVRADMRRLPLAESSLDGAASLFTSFGYFSSERENARVLQEVARVLKPGAPFVMDYFNLKPTLENLVAESQRKIGSITLREKRRYIAGTRRLTKTIVAIDGAKREVMKESVRAYTPRELKAMFQRAGLCVENVFGDLEGAAFDEKRSPRCVVLARKRKG